MTVEFYKYHGTGNDFIILDGRVSQIILDADNIKYLCDRRFGIGSDGLMILSNHPDFDFAMTYYNSDGHEGSMCGNGGRCIVAFANMVGINKKNLNFMAVDGPHKGEILQKHGHDLLVRLKMSDVSEIRTYKNHYEINTGSPHYIEFVNDLETKNVFESGKMIRNSKAFKKEGINVNFIQQGTGQLSVRTYERGVENETLSCGTGVTASAIAYALKNNILHDKLQINTLGGQLTVSFEKEGSIFRNVWLEGPATYVYKGEVTID